MAVNDPAKPKRSGVVTFMAGAVSGLVASTTLQPFDVIKTRMQAAAFNGNTKKSMMKCTRNLLQQEGVTALWAGVGPACIRLSCGAGLYFLVLDGLRTKLKEISPESDGIGNALQTFGSGAAARSLAAAALCPITVVKTRMEYAGISGLKYSNTASALVTIARKERLKGLFSGLGPTIMRDAPFSGLYLFLYTRLKKGLETSSMVPPTVSPFMLNFTSGAVAGAIATLVTHPPDVVRTRLQLTTYSKPALNAQVQKFGPMTLLEIAKAEGWSSLYVGVVPRVMRRTLQMAMTWSIYEEIVQVVERSLQTASPNGREA